ncbi:MAG TPA: glycosyltransferase family 9 protein [Bryobacteraceae bacterium]|nr:glycosyltransferase family 9 protein [Bryobacteraceae bacterium]
MSVIEQLGRGARVAVVRLRSLGDCVLTTPALALLKQSRPDLEIAVAVEGRFAAVFEGNPDVAALLEPDIGAARRWRPELCLNLHGGTRSMWMTALSGAHFRAGFAHHRYAWLYNARIPTAQEVLGVSRKVHTAEHLASAAFWLGAARAEIPRARLFTDAPVEDTGRYAVLHAMASTPEKTWPAERFGAVAQHLSQMRIEPVFIAGPGEDVTAFAEYNVVLGAPLVEVKALLAGAALFIGNDSGPAHMAAAFGIPSVVIFAASDPVVWAPWRTQAEVLVVRHGIGKLQVKEVMQAVERLKVAA